MQKCWTCENATGGCSWTAIDKKTGKVMFQPVPGWDATPTRRRLSGKTIMESYEIHDCPQYVPDGLSRLSLEDQVLMLHDRGMSLRQIGVQIGIFSDKRVQQIIEEETV